MPPSHAMTRGFLDLLLTMHSEPFLPGQYPAATSKKMIHPGSPQIFLCPLSANRSISWKAIVVKNGSFEAAQLAGPDLYPVRIAEPRDFGL